MTIVGLTYIYIYIFVNNLTSDNVEFVIRSILKKFQIPIIFRIPFRMEGLITLGKDILNRLEKSGVIYKLSTMAVLTAW